MITARLRYLLASAVLAVFLLPTASSAQLSVAEPFKVGTFEIEGSPRLGVVLRDRLIVDLHDANADLQRDPGYPVLPAPVDMIELIERYEYGLKRRLYEIVNHVATFDLDGMNRPPYVHDLSDVGTLPPIMYPGKILNAAVNFYSHVDETGDEEERTEARRQRRENRGVPYLFLKPSRGAVVGNGSPIVLPWGRDRIDWEVELGAVIGRAGKYISANAAEAHVFGYMVTMDISDRGGRPPGGNPLTSDWFVGKGHDTFAPQGPWIVPKEFYGDPMQRLHQLLTIDGITVQEARAGDMIHSLWELIEYASSLITLYPGDVLNSGTSGGTSMGAFETGVRSGYLEPGEEIAASIEGIGTLRHRVVAGEQPPADLSGAQLPPVETYQGGN